MYDGLHATNLIVVGELLTNERLTFLGRHEHRTGAVVEEGRDGVLRAEYRGLLMTAVRSRDTGHYRFELKGSIHKYRNAGLHNYDDLRAADLLAAVDELVTTLHIDPFRTRLNNLELGVNVRLPFPAQKVLDSLIQYKGRPFVPGPDGPIYYQCQRQRYVLKIYNKGVQCGVGDNLLRFEIKVLRMEYLVRQKVGVSSLADLLNVEVYPLLGALLDETFAGILFDEREVDETRLSAAELDLLLRGRDAKYWRIPAELTGREYERHRKRLQRAERGFRALLDRYRPGRDWQGETAALIRAKWQDLTAVSPDLLGAIQACRARWQGSMCPEITGCGIDGRDAVPPPMSRNNPRSLQLLRDGGGPGVRSPAHTPPVIHSLSGGGWSVGIDAGEDFSSLTTHAHTHPPAHAPEGFSTVTTHAHAGRCCPVTGIDISHQRPHTRFVTETTLKDLFRTDRPTFDRLAETYLTGKQAGGTLGRQCYVMAHNIRNSHSNPVRALRRLVTPRPGMPLLLFPVAEVVRPTARQRAVLDYRAGTRSAIGL